MESPTDEMLHSRFIDKDTSAFEELMRRHQEQVYRLAFRILGRVDDARDIAEEVFINLWENPTSFKPTARFSTWLYRVTTNRAISHSRLRRLKLFFTFTEDNQSEFDVDNPVQMPDLQLEQKERSEKITRAMMHLPVRQRVALHLRYREEMSVREIAGILKVSAKSAESLLFRGKEGLRSLLKQDD